MNANHQEKIQEKQKSISSEKEKLKSMIIDKQSSKDDHDDEALESENFIKKLEESVALFTKQCSAHGTLTQTFQKLRHDHERKEKSNRKNVELEKMLSISRLSSDEKYALTVRKDKVEKCMEEMQEELESFNQTTMAMEEMQEELEFFNQTTMAMESKELIKIMQEMYGFVNIWIKRLRDQLDLAPFAKKRKCSGSAPPPEAEPEQLLCFWWEKHLADLLDPGWHPFKMVTVGDKDQEIIDDEDPKLKALKSELDEDAYKAVTTSLVELNQHNPPNGRCPISEERRKAPLPLKDGRYSSVVLKKLKSYVGNNSVVSSPSIASTNSSSSGPGSNIVAANHSSPACCEIPDAVVLSPIIAATDTSSSAPSCLDGCEIPKAVFHDFMACKSYGNFQSGQIWALYCYSDELRRNYVQITQVKMYPDFELHVLHLGSSYPQERRIRWADKNMPICCGIFTVVDETEVVYKDTKAFSHMIHADLASESSYKIFPRKGEVWAVYKNFNPKWTLSDLKTCTYDIVEVLGVSNRKIRVDMLEQVSGYKTVFKPKMVSEVDHITRANSLTISYQIPAFRLTGQQEGSLRGYWELDPNSIPDHYFSSN